MKSLIYFYFVALLSTSLTWALTREEAKAAFHKILAECKTKVGASDADLESYANKKLPSSKEGLCLLECAFSSTNIMQDGKFSKDGMIQGFAPLVGDDATKKKNVEDLAAVCEKEIGGGDSDKCKTAKLVAECFLKQAKAHGVDMC